AGRVPEQLYRHRTAASYPRRVQQRLSTTWVLEVDGGVRGFVVVVDDEVEQVYVDAPARGTGGAGLLLAHAESEVAAAGHTRAWLAVVAGNARASACYERCGCVGARPGASPAVTAAAPVGVPRRRSDD